MWGSKQRELFSWLLDKLVPFFIMSRSSATFLWARFTSARKWKRFALCSFFSIASCKRQNNAATTGLTEAFLASCTEAPWIWNQIYQTATVHMNNSINSEEFCDFQNIEIRHYNISVSQNGFHLGTVTKWKSRDLRQCSGSTMEQ